MFAGFVQLQVSGRLHRERSVLSGHQRVPNEQRRLRPERSVHQHGRLIQGYSTTSTVLELGNIFQKELR